MLAEVNTQLWPGTSGYHLPTPAPTLTMLLVWIIGVVGHQLCVAWSLMVFFGHKYDSILPFLPAVGHDAARLSDLAAIGDRGGSLTL